MHEHRKRTPILRTSPADPATARTLQRRHAAGSLVRLLPGVFIERDVWEGLALHERHRTRARAVAPLLRPGSVFSHGTAAMIHGWPWIGNVGDRVHVLDPNATLIQHRAGVIRHPGVPRTAVDAAAFDGVPVTSALDTAVMLATSCALHVAAVAVDAAVRRRQVRIDELQQHVPRRPARGSVRAAAVLDALDPLHESAGESFAAARFVELGMPPWVSQALVRHADGTIDRLDFWFPSLGVVVEFDGRQKYVDPTMLDGRDPGDVLWAEKRREDRVRALPAVRTVVRATWWHLVELDRLRALFRAHGVPV
ncbi:hypothetical protein GCM10009706_01800 [Curtobacterium citreum]|uniref:Transcriptional regulator, AbiEi antitoxin, Type IV TA system n=1 Tax=Curtobacterium citreum TaxID=2036 RepID=A0ABT2HHM3_9MICO|nr:hypothetical protein [Curtobacterium citreum]MCS6522760.1 hypothetical protein [Curtobacterium citreum]TQJ28669.1 hypothetical protein FB462_2567 [Curtobacterium citreum]GGL66955.1 hypothetical protein GCM10009706_01800 [Curtobacterium citreum]